MKPGANVDLAGKALIAGQTLILDSSASPGEEEGLYMGVADKGGSRYLVVGHLAFQLSTIQVTTGTAVTTTNKLFKLHCKIDEKLVATVWNELGLAMRLNSTVKLLEPNNTCSEGRHYTCSHNVCIFHITCMLSIIFLNCDTGASVNPDNKLLRAPFAMFETALANLKQAAKVHIDRNKFFFKEHTDMYPVLVNSQVALADEKCRSQQKIIKAEQKAKQDVVDMEEHGKTQQVHVCFHRDPFCVYLKKKT